MNPAASSGIPASRHRAPGAAVPHRHRGARTRVPAPVRARQRRCGRRRTPHQAHTAL